MKQRLPPLTLLAILTILLLTLIGCGPTESASTPPEGASASGTLDEDAAGTSMPFQVPVAQAGDPIGIDFRGALQTGSVRVQLVDAGGGVVWQEEAADLGLFAINTVVEPPAPGEYQLGLAWDGPVTASYSLTWRPGLVEIGQVTPIALLSGAGMIGVAVGFIAYAAWRKLGWRYLGLGALAWVVTIILKFVWALAANQAVYNVLYSALPQSLASLLFYLYVGALTGLFEVTLVWLVMRYTHLGQMTWPHALAFGIGFGAVEALLLGVQSLVNVLVLVLMPALVPVGPEMIAQMNNPLYLLAPIVERFFAILLHTFSNLLIIYGVRTRRAIWYWLAFAYKTGIDAVAAFGQAQGLTTFPEIWAIETVVILWGTIGLLGIRWLRTHWDAGQPLSPEEGSGPRRQLSAP
jgi:uncharacterized membrane protein YhfC